MNDTTTATPHIREVGRLINAKGVLIVLLSDGRRVEFASRDVLVTKGTR